METQNSLPSILFVDDEAGILKALKRLFIDEDWEMFFASNGEDGLAILDQHAIDLVVSDVRMPGMDGITFLTEVKKRHPQVVRVFLSGYADQKAVVRAITEGCAQQILGKPWDDTEMTQVVRFALQQAREQQNKFAGLQKIINSLSALPSIPQIYLEVRKYLGDSELFSFEKASTIIEQDLALSAELIRWSNSAMFGQRNKVDTVKRALVVLGSDIVEGLILSNSVFKSMERQTEAIPGFHHESFHNHSIACGVLARTLIEDSTYNRDNLADRAFTAGLLHDIGKLVEESFLQDAFRQAVALAAQNNQPLSWGEKELLGTTHEEIGSYLADWWNMPAFLVESIRWHHTPGVCQSNQEIIAAVHVADYLAQRFNVGESGNAYPQDVDPASWRLFDLNEDKVVKLREKVLGITS